MCVKPLILAHETSTCHLQVLARHLGLFSGLVEAGTVCEDHAVVFVLVWYSVEGREMFPLLLVWTLWQTLI